MGQEARSDRLGGTDESWVDFDVRDEAGDRIGMAGPVYLNRRERPEFVGVRLEEPDTMVLLPIGLADVDEDASMIRVPLPATTVRNAPQIPVGAEVTDAVVRSTASHFGGAEASGDVAWEG